MTRIGRRICALLCVGLLVGSTGSATAQTLAWVRQLGSEGADIAYGVATDPAGNVYVCGETEGAIGGTKKGGVDAWLRKYDPAGAPLWKRQPGTADYDGARGVATDTQGNVYVTGTTSGRLADRSFGYADGWLIKYDATGRVLLRRQFGTARTDEAWAVAVDLAGNVLVAGITRDQGGQNDSWLIKFDRAGVVKWKKITSRAGDNYLYGVTTDATGNIYLSGQDHSLPRFAKYDTSGRLQWFRTPGQSGGFAFSAAIDANGDVVVTGNSGYAGPFVYKYGTDGAAIWRRRFPTSEYADGIGVAVDGSNNVYVAGQTFGSLGGTPHGDSDGWVMRLDPAGRRLWKRQIGTEAYEETLGLAADLAGNVYIAGVTLGSLRGPNSGGLDAWLAKYAVLP